MRAVIIDLLLLFLGFMAVKMYQDGSLAKIPTELEMVFNYFTQAWPG